MKTGWGKRSLPEDKVTIRGEVDSEWTTTQIDADMIQKILTCIRFPLKNPHLLS